MWTTVRGRCSVGQHRLNANGEYTGWCFDSISQGKWWVRNGNSIVIQDGPKKSDREIIVITRFEARSDRTFIDVQYKDGAWERWIK